MKTLFEVVVKQDLNIDLSLMGAAIGTPSVVFLDFLKDLQNICKPKGATNVCNLMNNLKKNGLCDHENDLPWKLVIDLLKEEVVLFKRKELWEINLLKSNIYRDVIEQLSEDSQFTKVFSLSFQDLSDSEKLVNKRHFINGFQLGFSYTFIEKHILEHNDNSVPLNLCNLLNFMESPEIYSIELTETKYKRKDDKYICLATINVRLGVDGDTKVNLLKSTIKIVLNTNPEYTLVKDPVFVEALKIANEDGMLYLPKDHFCKADLDITYLTKIFAELISHWKWRDGKGLGQMIIEKGDDITNVKLKGHSLI